MSLIDLFRSRTLCVGLEPGKLRIAPRAGRAFLAEAAFQQDLDNPDGHWHTPLAALQSYLQGAPAAARRFPLSVILSSRWCRMMMVPWSDALLRAEQARHFLQTQYIALYGESMRGWTVVADDRDYGQPRLACAMDSGLLDAVMRLAHAHGRTCVSVEPALSLALRALNRLPEAKLTAFSVIEDDCLSLVCGSGGRITALHTQQRGRTEAFTDAGLTNAWSRWSLRAPHIGNMSEIGVIDLRGQHMAESLAAPFKKINLPLHGLPPHFSFVAAGAGQ